MTLAMPSFIIADPSGNMEPSSRRAVAFKHSPIGWSCGGTNSSSMKSSASASAETSFERARAAAGFAKAENFWSEGTTLTLRVEMLYLELDEFIPAESLLLVVVAAEEVAVRRRPMCPKAPAIRISAGKTK